MERIRYTLRVNTDINCKIYINGEKILSSLCKDHDNMITYSSDEKQELLLCARCSFDEDILEKFYISSTIYKVEFKLKDMFLKSLPDSSFEVYEDRDKYGYKIAICNEIISPEYDFAYDFYDGMAGVKKNGKYGFIDKTGKLVIDYKYEMAYHFSEGYACVMNGEHKFGFINKKGELVIDFEYEEPSYFEGGIVIIKKNGKYGKINAHNEVIYNFEYEEISDVPKNNLGF